MGLCIVRNVQDFFPIIDEIPIMLPDELRDKKQEIEFLKRNIKELPEKIVKTGIAMASVRYFGY